MSASSVSWSADAGARYERLASEYAKLRAQAGVLKNGVLEERAKNEKLVEETKLKDASLRKLRSENESLSFRNEQLVKRVHALQHEVEDALKFHGQKASKSSKKDSKSSSTELELKNRVVLLEEELNNKLKQNVELINKISEMERLHTVEIAELSEKFAKELRGMEVEIATITSREKELLKEKENKDKQRDEKGLETAVVKPIQKKSMDHNSQLDLTPVAPPPQNEAYRMSCESARLCMAGLSTFMHLYSERTLLFPFDVSMEPLPQHVKKLSSEFSEASVSAQLVVDSLDGLLQKDEIEIPSDLVAVSSVLSHFSTLLENLNLGMAQLAIEESKGSWSDATLDRFSSSFYSSYAILAQRMRELSEAVANGDVEALIQRFGELSISLKDIHDSFCARWKRESRLPVTTKRLQCVCAALSDCLTQLSAESARLASRVQTAVHMNPVSEEESLLRSLSQKEGRRIEYGTERILLPDRLLTPKKSSDQRETSGNPFEEKEVTGCSISKDPNATVKVVEWLNRADLEKIKSLENEISSQRTRICELEAERERLLVEITLLKRKRKNEENENSTDKCPTKSEYTPTAAEFAMMKQYYTDKLKETFADVKKERDKAQYMESECITLMRLTKLSDADAREMRQREVQTQREKDVIEDELATVRRSYESQLSEMSRLLAELREKVDERETRQSQRSSIARKLLFQK